MNLDSKLFEYRDRMTCMSVMAFKFLPHTESERWLIARLGYGRTTQEQNKYVFLFDIGSQKCHYDPYAWDNPRTRAFHDYVTDHFDELRSGQVVDVRVILGEETAPATSDREYEQYDSYGN